MAMLRPRRVKLLIETFSGGSWLSGDYLSLLTLNYKVNVPGFEQSSDESALTDMSDMRISLLPGLFIPTT